MDIKTIILVTAGLITIGAMIYCIMRDTHVTNNTSTNNEQEIQIVDDQSESNYDTVDDGNKKATGGDESVYDSV